MRVVIEFYRTRDADDAHAVVGRVTAEAVDVAAAIDTARQLSLTIDMPQRPDAMTITDVKGEVIYSGVTEAPIIGDTTLPV
ncbi:MAG: hypothetical protein ABJG86_13150 [Nitratireductor sp.]